MVSTGYVLWRSIPRRVLPLYAPAKAAFQNSDKIKSWHQSIAPTVQMPRW